MKQETLEEAAEKYSKRSTAPVFQEAHKQDFISGAEWQAERMYSKQEYVKCTCANSLEYSNCDKKCERILFEEQEELAQKPIEPPIGDFIFANANAIQLEDGYYYHYSEVCKLLKLQAERMYSKEAVEEMFATLKRNSVDNIATVHNIDLFIESWTREFKKA